MANQITSCKTFLQLERLAERQPQAAITRIQHYLASNQPLTLHAQAWGLYSLGWAWLYCERFEQARECFVQAQALADTASQGRPPLRYAFALLLVDLYQTADPRLEERLAALASQWQLQPRRAAYTWLAQAHLLVALGRADAAQQVLARIEPALRARAIDRGRWLYLSAAAAIDRGEFAQATRLLSEAEAIFAAEQRVLDQARCWFQRGWSALSQEQPEQALGYYQRAEQIFTQYDLPLRRAVCAKNLGLLYARTGEYDEALRVLLVALPTFVLHRRYNDIGTCQLNLGNIYYYTGQWDAALACYLRAEAIYDQAGVVRERQIARRNRAMVYRAQQHYPQARELLTELAASTAPDSTELAAIWSERAALFAADGDLDAALYYYQRAEELFLAQDNRLAAADVATEQGWVKLGRGDIASAEVLFARAAGDVGAHPYSAWRTSYGLARCAVGRADRLAAFGHFRAAVAIVANLRRRLASEAASSGQYLQAERLYTDFISYAASQGAYDELLQLSEAQRALVLQRALTSQPAAPTAAYREALAALQTQVAMPATTRLATGNAAALDDVINRYSDVLLHSRHSSSTVALPQQGFDLAACRARLTAHYGPTWMALVYTLAGDQLFICILTATTLQLEQTTNDQRLRELLMRANQADYRLMTYRDLAYQPGQPGPRWALLDELARRLLPPQVHNWLHPARRLLIVPTGSLHSLPWAALRVGVGWLAEQAIVHVVPSLTTWEVLSTTRPTASGQALLVGCSEYQGRGATLSGVSEELTAAAARWPGSVQRLDNQQATVARLMAMAEAGELARLELLHIAGHAQLLPGQMLAAHIKLWDGDLWLPDIANLRLKQALVVLSACHGAAAQPLPGDETLSLCWAFLAAGASGVLSSIWPIADRAALLMIATFYGQLRLVGDPVIALAQAQRTLIARHRATNEPIAEPFCWGSFLFIGGQPRLLRHEA